MQAKDLTLTNARRELIYQRSHKAGQMEAVMLIVSGIAVIGAIFAFLNYGWWPSLALFILGAISFGVSRLFDLMGDLFGSIEDGK